MTDIRIRKLTPTECYKLMGFSAEDCKKASDGGVSNSQLYKQAGNSIVVNVLEAIFTSLGENYEEFRGQLADVESLYPRFLIDNLDETREKFDTMVNKRVASLRG